MVYGITMRVHASVAHDGGTNVPKNLYLVQFAMQIQSEFPGILSIKESLIKYVFEPNAAKVRGPVIQSLLLSVC